MNHTTRPGRFGSWLLLAASIAGLIVSIVNYWHNGNGIAHSAGALLVIVSTALLLLSALALLRDRRRRWTRVLLHVWICIDLFGIGVAAWFLEADWLLVLMVIGFIGWLIHLLAAPRTSQLPVRPVERERLA